MWRRPIVQGLMRKLRGDPNLELIYEPDYNNANTAIRSNDAGIALIEVAESGEYDSARCLGICSKLRKEAPECKLLLMCPEQDKLSVVNAVEAKRDGLIDDFVFYDSTYDYLESKLMSI
jgi:hypothetical protein